MCFGRWFQVTGQIRHSVLLIDVERAAEHVHRSAPFARFIHAVGTLCRPEPDRCVDLVERKNDNPAGTWGRRLASRGLDSRNQYVAQHATQNGHSRTVCGYLRAPAVVLTDDQLRPQEAT